MGDWNLRLPVTHFGFEGFMKTLVKKLAEVGAEIGEIVKQGEGDNFSYLRALDVFNALRLKVFSRGIVIIPETMQAEYAMPFETVSGDVMEEVRVKATYRITDGTETLIGAGLGVGRDYRGKALYAAQTGALKYFLQAIGLIAGVEDDAETTNDGPIPEGLAEKLDEAEKRFGPDLREHPISQRDVRAFGSACKASGFRDKHRTAYLKSTFGIEHISDLKRKDFEQALAWAVDKPITPEVSQ